MKSLIHALKTYVASLSSAQRCRRFRGNRPNRPLSLEPLGQRVLLTTTAVNSGDWSDASTWDMGVPDDSQRAIIASGVTVELDGTDHYAQELVIQGDLVVTEETGDVNKTLETRWVHINSGGEFIVGSAEDRYDNGTFTLKLTGTDVYADHNIEGITMPVVDNDGFLMTAKDSRIQFYGEDKLSFTKLHTTAEMGESTIIVENVIERNFAMGEMDGSGEFVTSADDDGAVNWEDNDRIVIASSSYDYRHEDVRTITRIVDNDDGTSTLTLNAPLTYRHYGEIETYGETVDPLTTDFSRTYAIDMRAEVALLSRNVKIQGDAEQDTDQDFGDRWNVVTEDHVSGKETHISGGTFTTEDINVVDRIPANGLSPAEIANLPAKQITNGVGGHIMIMKGSDPIVIDGVQLEGLGQASQKGRYPIHWHLGGDRSEDVLRNSSVTNSNNRGVTIHGTQNLHIEGVVLHDIHGHGFFFEDAVETGNTLVGNIALGIHTVGGNDNSFADPGERDPFIVDTHDSVLETGSRFSSSAAFWITNPANTLVGNIAAGAGDSRFTDPDDDAHDYADPGPAGTGFWYALPRTVLGDSSKDPAYDEIIPIFAEFGQFDNNTSHSTAVGLNFDRGSDIEDANMEGGLRTNHTANEYSPRMGGLDIGAKATSKYVNGFTNYKAAEAAVYHRGDAESIKFNGLRIADSYNGPWSVSENQYDNSLFVGHSKRNADLDVKVGGPRLYDGAGLYTNTHFAGFADPDAYAFQVEGSSFGPTMYHAFESTSFENDGTYDHIAHAVSDATTNVDDDGVADHDLGQPHQWVKAVMDIDGTLTGGIGGGAGYSIVPNIDFLVEEGDASLTGEQARLTDDIYARVRVENNNDGSDIELFSSKITGEPLIRFTARDGDAINVMAGQSTGDHSWTQIAAKTDGDGRVEGDLTIEFGRNGVPKKGFVLNMKNQDGGRPVNNPDIQARVDAARIVTKIVAAANYTPDIGTLVGSEEALRLATTGVVYYRDDLGNLYLNTGISNSQPLISLKVDNEIDPLQTAFVPRTVNFGATIEAEAFDNGIDGIAYHDSDATSSSGSFRDTTGVDVITTPTRTKVGDIADGEWLEYTADIESGAYRIGVNVSSSVTGGRISILAANSNSSGALRELGTREVPNTEGEFSTVWFEAIDLDFAAGTDSVIRLEFPSGGFEFDSVQFAASGQTAYVIDRIIMNDPNADPTRIELEEYDNGGEGVAYHDDSPTNDALDENNNFRPDEGVDASDSLVTNSIKDGEWLEYTTDIQPGTYDITLGKAWGGDTQSVKLYVGESNSVNQSELDELGEFFFTAEGGESITLNDVRLPGGIDSVIRIEMIGSFFGLDYLEFAPIATTANLPCDFVGDGNGCDIADLDALFAGNNSAPTPLTEASITQWLTRASDPSNPAKLDPGHQYVAGDLNLDGTVDSADLGLLLNNFGDTTNPSWSEGNVNTDAAVNSTDLGVVLNNFGFTSTTTVAATSTYLRRAAQPVTTSSVANDATSISIRDVAFGKIAKDDDDDGDYQAGVFARP